MCVCVKVEIISRGGRGGNNNNNKKKINDKQKNTYKITGQLDIIKKKKRRTKDDAYFLELED